MAGQVGFIGLGVMGRGMAKNVAEAGNPLTVHDVNPAAVRELEQFGAQSAATPREVAQRVDVLVTVLPATPQVEQVYLGPGGIVEGLRPGAITIDCSTISPVTARKVAEAVAAKGGSHLDAGMTASNQPPRRPEPSGPGLSRTVAQAQAGTMKLVVGGERATFDAAHDVLNAMSQEQIYCGPSGSGMVVKLANNMFVAAAGALYYEVFVWAQKNGVPPATVLDAFKRGMPNSVILSAEVEGFALKRRFEAGIFPVDYMYTDLTEGLHAAGATQTPMPLVSAVRQILEMARAQGMGGTFYPCILQIFEQMAGGPELSIEP